MANIGEMSSVNNKTLKKQVIQGTVFLLALGAALVLFIIFFGVKFREAGNKKNLLVHWEQGAWMEVYETSKDALASKPMDAFYLTINGFAAYQAAMAQINNSEALEYIDQCIWTLRKALLGKNTDKDGRIRYVLGKAYYAKGPDYADLSVRYLEEAKSAVFSAGDLNEYLGLAYAAIKDYRKSIEALTASLASAGKDADSDMLLMRIAQSYMGLEDWEMAKTYLIRCIDASRDTGLALKSRLFLGKVLRNSGDLDGAIAAFDLVLEESGENAEAAFEIGEIYASRGDTIRARAAWRRAHRSDPNFAPVMARLNTL
ncbi:MAG: tetratricopeptide repeat protein [Spirochaetaceae bacterium]|jgi:tetratricopeptide (TPR) repeat protein|nr:tetratricopeptide repeat protein [Spirochaetaceae bacterium]